MPPLLEMLCAAKLATMKKNDVRDLFFQKAAAVAPTHGGRNTVWIYAAFVKPALLAQVVLSLQSGAVGSGAPPVSLRVTCVFPTKGSCDGFRDGLQRASGGEVTLRMLNDNHARASAPSSATAQGKRSEPREWTGARQMIVAGPACATREGAFAKAVCEIRAAKSAAAAVLLVGPSGSGKSFLLRRLVDGDWGTAGASAGRNDASRFVVLTNIYASGLGESPLKMQNVVESFVDAESDGDSTTSSPAVLALDDVDMWFPGGLGRDIATSFARAVENVSDSGMSGGNEGGQLHKLVICACTDISAVPKNIVGRIRHVFLESAADGDVDDQSGSDEDE